MKKIFIVCVVVIILVTCFVGCGNKAFLDPGSFNFEHVHVTDHVEGHCFSIEKWWDNESGIEVRTTNGNGMFLSEGTYQLFESAASCPYCD
jgi:hypothetical protein